MQMTHKHDVYFSPHSTEAYNLVMQIADYCNKRGIWYKISESTLGIGIVYGGNVGYVIDADRKTEPTTEDCSTVKPQNYCDDCLYTDTCDSKEFFYACTSKATISKMEQVDKDIDVRSKDEPQMQLTARCLNCNNAKACKEKHWEDCVYEPKDEKTCETCRHWKYIAHEWQCEACKCQGYKPKDEPQTDTEIAKAIVHKMIDDAVIAEDAYPDLRQKMHDAVDEYEPQTERGE